MKNDIQHLYEMLSDIRHEVAGLKLELEYLRVPWPLRWIVGVQQFMRAPFSEWGKTRHGGDL